MDTGEGEGQPIQLVPISNGPGHASNQGGHMVVSSAQVKSEPAGHQGTPLPIAQNVQYVQNVDAGLSSGAGFVLPRNS